MLRSLVIAVASFLSTSWCAHAASISDLLHPSKTMPCTPEKLTQASSFTIDLPDQHGDFLLVLVPFEDYRGDRYVVYPQPRWPLKLSAEKFKKLTSVSFKVRDLVGTSWSPNYVFSAGGRYTVIVGSKFDTPAPVVDGWCALDYVAPVPVRRRTTPDPGPLREGHPWNKMKCSPAVVTPDSILTISLPFPHGPYLEIAHKEDAFFVIASATSEADAFERMRSISLRVSDVMVPARSNMRRVFSEPGVYTISVGRTFEVERAVDGWCRVQYRVPKRRR